MADSKEQIRFTCTHTRLRESVIAFYALGLFTGCCTHRYPTLAIVLGTCSMLVVCVQWWVLQALNERERNSRNQHGDE